MYVLVRSRIWLINSEPSNLEHPAVRPSKASFAHTRYPELTAVGGGLARAVFPQGLHAGTIGHGDLAS